jgi:uracil phosphoribosyltransferase
MTLAGIHTYEQPVLAALEHLEEAGVESDDIILVCATISKAACERICKASKELRIITGTLHQT